VIAGAAPLIVHASEDEFNPDQVTPGVWGFVLTFVIMVIVALLILDMVRRIRRVNYRAVVRQQLEVERLAAEGGAAGTDAAGTTPGADAAASDDDDLPPSR